MHTLTIKFSVTGISVPNPNPLPVHLRLHCPYNQKDSLDDILIFQLSCFLIYFIYYKVLRISKNLFMPIVPVPVGFTATVLHYMTERNILFCNGNCIRRDLFPFSLWTSFCLFFSGCCPVAEHNAAVEPLCGQAADRGARAEAGRGEGEAEGHGASCRRGASDTLVRHSAEGINVCREQSYRT